MKKVIYIATSNYYLLFPITIIIFIMIIGIIIIYVIIIIIIIIIITITSFYSFRTGSFYCQDIPLGRATISDQGPRGCFHLTCLRLF